MSATSLQALFSYSERNKYFEKSEKTVGIHSYSYYLFKNKKFSPQRIKSNHKVKI